MDCRVLVGAKPMMPAPPKVWPPPNPLVELPVDEVLGLVALDAVLDVGLLVELVVPVPVSPALPPLGPVPARVEPAIG